METAIAVMSSKSTACMQRFWKRVLADAAEEAVNDAHLFPRLMSKGL